jgi:pimeloyl-ACP methyl ester carboxylesterase
MDALKSAPRLRVPVLYLAAADDDNAGYDFSRDAEAMHAASAAVDKRLEVLPGSLHGIALVADSPQARTLIRAFLTAH